jgi:hypothetical protein
MSIEQAIFDFVLTGTMPLLMHGDDIEASDELTAWRKHADNKSVRVAGDDRSPPWTWQTYLYTDGERVAMPQENVMTALRDAGKRITTTGKATFKSLSQSGLLIDTGYLEFLNRGEPIAMADVTAFRNAAFVEHKRRARDLGFDLSVKRARVGSSKHIRVRPRFDNWSIRGSIYVLDAAITDDILRQLFEIAGKYIGLCDWRPSAKESPGPHGTFTAALAPAKAARKKSA